MSNATPQYPPGHDPRTVESSADIKYNLGEGLEKREEDFAAEVAAQMGK